MGDSLLPFDGFPAAALSFLAGLERNNEKGWFEARRTTYEQAIVAPALGFAVALADSLRELAPSVAAEPRVGGSLFRIHRDTRFSADKRPYKTRVGIRLRDADTARSSKCTGPLFYVELDARHLRLGVGVKQFDSPTLAAYRRALAERGTRERLGKLVRRADRAGHEIVGERLRRVPAKLTGLGDDELARRKGLFVSAVTPHPRELHRRGFVDSCRRWFAPYVPLFAELRSVALAAME